MTQVSCEGRIALGDRSRWSHNQPGNPEPMTEEHCRTYYSATARDKRGFPTLAGDVSADVAIVGGGFTGIATAVELAERGLDVVVLEANRIGWGATGRNGGQVTGSLSGDTAMLRQFGKTLGKPGAADYVWNLRWRGHDIIRKRVATYGIDCDLTHGHIEAAIGPGHLKQLEAVAAEARSRGFGDDLTLLDRPGIRQLIGTDLYIGGLRNMRNMHLHSLDLCVGEARAAETLGARIFEDSSVTHIEHGSRPRVVTGQGIVEAGQVLIAGNALHLLEQRALGGALFPASLANMATAPLSASQVEAVNPQNLAVYDCRFVLDYYRLTADKRLMFGGGTNYSGRSSPDVAAELRPAMERTFPQLEGIAIDYAWNCSDGIIANRIPQAGRVAPNVLFVQGYSGHGIGLTHIMAEIAANAMTGHGEEFDLFAGVRHLRLPFARSFGSQIQAIGMGFYTLRDRFR